MPMNLSNDTMNAAEQTLEESLREYAALMQSYDHKLADSRSLVLPLMAGVIARVIDVEQIERQRAGLIEEHLLPPVREIVLAAEAGNQTLSAQAEEFLRPLILMGASRLPDHLPMPSALRVLEVRSVSPNRIARTYARWLKHGFVNPAIATLLGCRFAEDRLLRHPYPLLVASNSDLRRPLEKFLTRLGITNPTDAALLGAKTLNHDLGLMLRSVASREDAA